MREIKFRGYDGADWIYGSAIIYNKHDKTWYMVEFGAPDDDWVIVEQVGQYTGLKDKNRKEVYEGDIIQYENHRLVVEWSESNASFSFGWIRNDYAARLGEVVGNIYGSK